MDQINILELMQLKMRLENYFILILKAKTNVELMPRLCYLNRLLTLLPLRRYRDSLPFYRELVIFTEDSLFLPRTRYFYREHIIFTKNSFLFTCHLSILYYLYIEFSWKSFKTYFDYFDYNYHFIIFIYTIYIC